ncbi:hypothetical protein BaRGS_00012725 [Batillaria attramentaria]|uniref:Uncharacterized protein n=1 Tax=Batillaria attramentaria TaxID=370345 RepID=A0ABD0L9E8_9CAEN
MLAVGGGEGGGEFPPVELISCPFLPACVVGGTRRLHKTHITLRRCAGGRSGEKCSHSKRPLNDSEVESVLNDSEVDSVLYDNEVESVHDEMHCILVPSVVR